LFNKLDEFHGKHLTRKVIMYRRTLLAKFRRVSMEMNCSTRMSMDKMDLNKNITIRKQKKECYYRCKKQEKQEEIPSTVVLMTSPK